MLATALVSAACGSSTAGSASSAGGAGTVTVTAGASDMGADAAGASDMGGADGIPAGGSTNGVAGASNGGAGSPVGTAGNGGMSAQPPTGAVACNSSNMVGTWEAAGTGGFSVYVTFESDGKFEFYIVAAAATAGKFNIEQATGTYTISGGVYPTTTTEFSCPSSNPAGLSSCYIIDGALISNDLIKNTTTAWAPAKAPSLSNATIGCFEDSGFVPYPLSKLP